MSVKKINPDSLSLKMLETYCPSTTDADSIKFSVKWTGAGMMSNGVLTTPKIIKYRKTDVVYSLSDFLEEHVEEKYYLSQEKVNRLVNK